MVELPPELEESRVFTDDLISHADQDPKLRNNRIRTSPLWKTYMVDAGIVVSDSGI